MQLTQNESLVTTSAILTPVQFREFLNKADKLGVTYEFVNNNQDEAGTHLLCMSEGADYAGLTVILKPDGTWQALVDVVVGTQL